MQRITKLPLLLRELKKHTESLLAANQVEVSSGVVSTLLQNIDRSSEKFAAFVAQLNNLTRQVEEEELLVLQ